MLAPQRIYSYPIFRKDLQKPKLSHFELSGSKLHAPLQLPSSFAIPVPFAAFDQGYVGSCVAQSTVAAYRLMQPSLQTASRMFVYTAGKKRENELNGDGMMLDDGLECLQYIGVCDEKLCPYNPAAQYSTPSPTAYAAAAANKIVGFGSVTVDTINALKRVLLNNIPVLIAVAVYTSFESLSADGKIPIPNKSHESLLGGHAMTVVGYDDSKQAALVFNSWGPNWGTHHPLNSQQKGYCWIPYSYIMDRSLTVEFLYSLGPRSPPPPPAPPKPAPTPPRPAPAKPAPAPAPPRRRRR